MNAGAATGSTWPDSPRATAIEYDHIRDHAWRYRDYVIRSLNADRPYSQFVREQIAGDVLEPVTQDGIIATGFLVAGPWDEANQIQSSMTMKQRVREEELEDMVAAVGQSFLGLTVNCARCHDHKFDPVRQRDYYRIKAALEGVLHGSRPITPGADPKGQMPPLTYAARPNHQRRRRHSSSAAATSRRQGERVAAGGLSAVRVPVPGVRRWPTTLLSRNAGASSPNGSPIPPIR